MASNRRAAIRVALPAFGVVVAIVVIALAVDHRRESTAHDLHVYNPHHNSATNVQRGVEPGRVYAFIMPPLCTTGRPAKITGVTPLSPRGGIAVVDWAVTNRMPNFLEDGAPGTAADLPSFYPDTPVAAPCTPDGTAGFALGLKTTTSTGSATGWEIRSSAGTVFVSYGLTLAP